MVNVRTRQREEMVDVTGEVRRAVQESGAHDGICLVYSPHTTCGVTVNEGWDPDVAADAVAHLHELAPREKEYRHAEGNSDAHIKTMLVGNSVSLPIAGGEPRLGRWQAVFLCEYDGPRERELWVTTVGKQE